MTTGRINQVNWVGCWVVELLLPPQYIYIHLSLSVFGSLSAHSCLAWLGLTCPALPCWAGLPPLMSAVITFYYQVLVIVGPSVPSREAGHTHSIYLSHTLYCIALHGVGVLLLPSGSHPDTCL